MNSHIMVALAAGQTGDRISKAKRAVASRHILCILQVYSLQERGECSI